MHDHPWFVVVFVERGGGHYRVDGQQIAVAAGDVCWVAPGQAHDTSGLAGVTAWTLEFYGDAVAPGDAEPLLLSGPPRQPWLLPFVLAMQHRRCHVALPAALHARWRAGLSRIAHELEAQPVGYHHATQALLALLLLDVARQVGDDSQLAPPHSALTEAVFRFIEQHYRRPIGLRDVARAVSRSPAYLTDRVRRETGRPVIRWLTERRMAEARRLLRSSELSTEQVAEHAGFGDPRHFARQFRRLNGLPPQAWRAAARGARATARPKQTPRGTKSSTL